MIAAVSHPWVNFCYLGFHALYVAVWMMSPARVPFTAVIGSLITLGVIVYLPLTIYHFWRSPTLSEPTPIEQILPVTPEPEQVETLLVSRRPRRYKRSRASDS